MVTVSIVTPSFNQGHFIEESIRSVLSQKGNFLIDYIVMDGGSSDASPEIIRKYDNLLRDGTWPVKCRGIRYRWVSEKDKGQVDAIQRGFARAEGDIGGWLNSDDVFLDENVFAKVVSEFGNDHNLMILTGDGPFIDREGKSFGVHHVDAIDFTELLYLDYHILQPATFLRNPLYKDEPLDASYHYCFDAEYFIRLISKGYPYKKVDTMFACFRLYPETKTLSGLGRRYRESLRIAAKYGRNRLHYIVAACYRYFEIVLQNRHPGNAAVKRTTGLLRPLAYRLVLGRWGR